MCEVCRDAERRRRSDEALARTIVEPAPLPAPPERRPFDWEVDCPA